MEKKKKSANYIIPATFFQALSPRKKKNTTIIAAEPKEIATPTATVPKTEIQKVVEKPAIKKPILKNVGRLNTQPGKYSLKGFNQQKEVKKTVVEENFEQHPKTTFTEEKLQELWKAYVALLNTKGERSMASIVGTDIPTLGSDFKITFTVPNKLMEDQFKKRKTRINEIPSRKLK